MKKWAVLSVMALGLAVLSWSAQAQDSKPKWTIKEIMKKYPKLVGKVNKGEGTDEEKKDLVALVKGLWENTPKKGDAEAWKTRTASILKEAEAGEKGGFKVGTDCKGCHNLHKGK